MEAIKELEAQIKGSDERVESFERALEIESTARGVLARELEKLKAEQQQWPQEGDSYFTYDSEGAPMEALWGTFSSEGVYLKLGMIFKAKKELLIDKSRREAETEVLRMLREYEGDAADLMYTAGYDVNGDAIIHAPCLTSGHDSWYSTEEAWDRVLKEKPEMVGKMYGVE